MSESAVQVENPSIASNAPTPAEGRLERSRDRMNVTLIQHAQHNIDHDNRRQQQIRFALERIPEFRRAAGDRSSLPSRGRPMSASRFFGIASTAAPSELPGLKLNDNVTAGNWPS